MLCICCIDCSPAAPKALLRESRGPLSHCARSASHMSHCCPGGCIAPVLRTSSSRQEIGSQMRKRSCSSISCRFSSPVEAGFAGFPYSLERPPGALGSAPQTPARRRASLTLQWLRPLVVASCASFAAAQAHRLIRCAACPLAVPEKCFGLARSSHFSTAAPFSPRFFRHWRRSVRTPSAQGHAGFAARL